MTVTASMKRKRKAGRGGHNKREDVPRYPSGRINYDEMARREDVTKLARDTRMRLYGVAANDAASDKAGSVFGRMYLQGELGKIRDESGVAETIYEAGMEFARRRKAYLHAIQAPRPTRSGSDIGYVHERLEGEGDVGITGAAPPPLDDEGYADRCASAKARYAEVRRVVMEADSMGLMALETIICEDKPAGGMMGALRVSCNAIARMMRTAKGSRARAY